MPLIFKSGRPVYIYKPERLIQAQSFHGEPEESALIRMLSTVLILASIVGIGLGLYAIWS